ncbi:MAG: hypothetical protein M1840_001736 [Geoglossum simile]|nr:MAG: hypothetical protein M1840_001736 [Geoglossum simile]
MAGLASEKTQLPGFGLPVSYIPGGDGIFPTALYGNSRERQRITVREFHMMQVMNLLTDKPEWDRKLFDDHIIAKWRGEALSQGNSVLSDRSVDRCFEELKHEATRFKETGIIRALDGGVFKADTLVPHAVKEALKKACRPLEDIPPQFKDWHPGSDGKVLDLVHPSLFPLIYGRSKILPHGKVGLRNCLQRSGEGVTVPVPSQSDIPPASSRYYPSYEEDALPQNAWSCNYQWLPCDVHFNDDRAVIQSYINNLNPEHKELYSVIEVILERAIPMFNMTLTVLRHPSLHPTRILCDEIVYPAGFSDHEYEWFPENETEADRYENYENWQNARDPIVPEPGEFEPKEISASERVDLRRDFLHSGIQIIVKLASIHLTPEKPEYEGGSWHVEGQMNEHIVSTALYYYDSKNISESVLAFRRRVDADLDSFDYEQSDFVGFEKLFGCSGDSPAVQDLGEVVTKVWFHTLFVVVEPIEEDRLLTFPNTFQHRVGPFRLADPTKPGHRKILAFFLVDPNIRDVEDFPISMEAAKRIRESLMDERRAFVENQDEEFNRVSFSLCEH